MRTLTQPCSEKTEVYSRVVGYFRPVQQWNVGKKHEYHNRRTFRIDAGDANILEFPVTPDAPLPDQRISGNVSY